MTRRTPAHRARAAARLFVPALSAVALFAGAADGAPQSVSAEQVLFTSMRHGSLQIYSILADGSGEQRMTSAETTEFQPAWAKDGRIAFVSHRSGNGDIYVMNGDGSDLRRVTRDAGLDQLPSWSPDAGRIAFTGERAGRTRVLVVNADGSDEQSLSDDYQEAGSPVWSPDGRSIAFVASVDSKTRIVIADLARGTTRLASDGKGGERSPVWSPDGRTLLYAQSGSRTEGVSLRIVDVASGRSRALTNNSYLNSGGRFSPDGSRVVFISNADSQGGPMNVHVINADGTGMTNLTHWQHADLEPTWSADGRSIYFMSFKDWPGQLYRMDADGGQVTRLTNGTAQEGFPVARPAAPASMPQATAR